MTTDNSRYEEAAEAQSQLQYNDPKFPYRMAKRTAWKQGFLAGASFAEKQSWNAAIDKVLGIILKAKKDNTIGLTLFSLEKELEKLKL